MGMECAMLLTILRINLHRVTLIIMPSGTSEHPVGLSYCRLSLHVDNMYLALRLPPLKHGALLADSILGQ